MTVESWLDAAIADAERRGLTGLKPILETLARSTAALREADRQAIEEESRSTDQRGNGSTDQRGNGSTNQRGNGSTDQRGNGSA